MATSAEDPATSHVENEGPAIETYLPYVRSDVDALAQIVIDSPKAELVVAALVLDYGDSTPETFKQAQDFLKEALQEELIDKNAGALKPKKTRLAKLLFQVDDGRLVLGEDDLPIFMSESEDGTVSPLSVEVASKIVEVSKAKAELEKRGGLSAQLYASTMGLGDEGEVAALKNVASLSRKVRSEFEKAKGAIFEAFEIAAEGTTEEELTAKKAALEQQLVELNAAISQEDSQKVEAERTIASLNAVFKEMLMNVDLAEELPDIDALVGGDASSLSVGALFQTIVDQFKRKADREKAQSSAKGLKEGLETQRLRAETMLQNNTDDYNRANGRISVLRARVVQANAAISAAISGRTSAQSRATRESTAAQNAQDVLNGYATAQQLFETAMGSSSVNYSAFNQLDMIVSSTNIRTAVTRSVNAKSERESAEQLYNSADSTLRQRQTAENSAYSQKVAAQNHTRSCLSAYYSTAARLPGRCNTTYTNPAKYVALQRYQWAQNYETTMRNRYNSAVANRQNAQNLVNSRRTNRTSKRNAATAAETNKTREARSFQTRLDGLKTTANNNKIGAQARRSQALTAVSGYNITIQNKTSDKQDDEAESAEEEAELQQIAGLIAIIQGRLNEIRAKEQAANVAEAEAAPEPEDQPSSLSPQEESAASVQLMELMDQRKHQTDAIAAHVKRATQLRAEAVEVEAEIESTTEELSTPSTDRHERRQMAEMAKNDSLRQAITTAAEQLKAVLTTAGYESFGAWSGETGEAVSVPVLRLLVADVKALATPVEIRRRAPEVAYEQLPGSEVAQVDVDNVERIVQKLLSEMEASNESLKAADPVNLLQAAESLVRSEFSSDLDVTPSKSILVNACSGDDVSWENAIVDPSTITRKRLVYKCDELYETDESSPDWVVLESIVDNTSTPVEDFMADLVATAAMDWALDACAKYLVESWLKHKSLKLANVEDLGNLITKFETLRENPDKSAGELDIFRQPPQVASNETSFVVAKSIVDRILTVRSAVLKLEKGVVDASELEIVNIAQSTRYSFDKFNKALSQRAIELVSSEIVRRKTAILSGDTSELGGAAAGEASALEEKIESQQLAIDEAQKQMQGLQEDYQKALTDAENSAKIWTTYETNLSNKIDKLESDLATKNSALAAVLADHASTEAEILQQLDDTEKLREEIAVLDSQRTQVQDKVDAAQKAVEAAQQDLNRGEGEVAVLDLKRQHLLDTKQAAEIKRDGLREWITFVRNIATKLRDDTVTIVQRGALAKEYKALEGGDVSQQMFTLVGKYFPSLKTAADKFKTSADALKKLDLRQALDQHLQQYPSIDYQPKSRTLPGIFTLQGISLSYEDVEEALLAFVTERCSRAGLVFETDGQMSARDDSALPFLESESIPLPIRELIKDRVSRFFQPEISGAVISWDKYTKQRTFKAAADTLMEMKEWCGISRWDVLRAYGRTVEIVVANKLVVNKAVALPGINLYVTAGEDIHVHADCDINTSPTATQLKHSKARNGNAYPCNPAPNGRHGDSGLNAPAGLNAGHVTMNAHRNLTWDSSLCIQAIGAVGSDGQDGGDGDKGRDGLKGKDGEAKDTDGGGNKQVSWAWTRYPGCDNDGRKSQSPGRINELSGPGGNGGLPGAGGQGGSGGEVILMDKERPKIHMMPDASNMREGWKSAYFGTGSYLMTLRDGKDGKNSVGVGRGGEGGEPGERGLEMVRNKKNWFYETKTMQGYIRKNYKRKLGNHVLIEDRQAVVNEDWGWRKYDYGFSYDPDDFEERRHPWLSAADAQRAKLSEMSRGSPGAPGGGSGGGGGTEHAKQRQRQTNANISAEDEYQRQKYQMVQTLQREEQFASIDTMYVAQEQALQQQINALSTQLTTTTSHRQEAQENVNRMRQREEQLSSESEQLAQQMQTINNLIKKDSAQVRASDKVALSKIISSLQQSETIAQLSQEIQDNTIDRKYDAKAIAKLQTIAAGIQALQLAKQMEIQREQEQLQQQISALTAEMLKTEQLKGQLANVSAASALDALLQRTQELQKQQVTQQQRKQKSVQVEADPDADEIDHLVGTSILLSVRDTFARGDAPGSVWPALGNSAAKVAVETVIAAVSSVEEGKRALTVELLEVLTRYCIFIEDLTVLEGLVPLADPTTADTIVLDALKGVDDDLRWNHWFIGHMTGATLMITSAAGVTVDQASLTSRFEQVEGISVYDSLTPLERNAAKLVNDLETVGTNLQHIAQFVKEYHETMLDAMLFTRQGYLSILQGNPVKFIDKLSRIVLMFFRRNDDTLAEQNLELAIGIAKTVQLVADTVGIYVLEKALTRLRDIRGGGGYTKLFLLNAESARPLLANGDSSGALIAMRNKDVPGHETDRNLTEYGPRTYDALLAEIDKVVAATSTADIATKLTAIARALGTGIAARTTQQLMDVLTRVSNIDFTGEDAVLKNAAAWGPIAACATMGINVLSVALSGGDKSAQTTLRNAATSRLSVPYLPARERVSRVLAFFRFIAGEAGQLPEWTVLEDNIGNADVQEEKDMNRKLLYGVLSRQELLYPSWSTANESFVKTLHPTMSYEEAVERLAYNVITEKPDYSPAAGGTWRRAPRVAVIAEILNANPEQSPVTEFLVHLALQYRKMQVIAEMRTQFMGTMPSRVDTIRSIAHQKLSQVWSRALADDMANSIVNIIVFGLPVDVVRNLWEAARDGHEANLMLLVVAMLQSEDDATLEGLREQLKSASLLFRRWPSGRQGLDNVLNLLHESTIAIVRTLAGNTVAKAGTLVSTETPYLVEVLESALSVLAEVLSDPPADSDKEMHASQLDLLYFLNDVIRLSEEEKVDIGAHATTEERDAAYLEVDKSTLKRVLMICTAFVVSGDSPGPIDMAMWNAFSAGPLADEVALRVQVATALSSAQTLKPSQLALAQGLYLTTLARSSERRLVIFETDEVLEVVTSLLAIWKEKHEDDSRTAALALIQILVLKVREKERDDISAQLNRHATVQDALVDSMKATLPTATVSTDGKESPALVSENLRRVQLWYICLSQINDEEMRLQKPNGLWSSVHAELQAATDADEFEIALARNVNRVIYAKRSEEERASWMPNTLKAETRNAWATDNWTNLNHLINWAKYVGVQASSFDYNVILEEIVEDLALVLLEVEAKTKEEPVTETVERCDAIAWILDTLAAAYEGMYMTSRDDDLIMKLSSTVEDLSRRGDYGKASAKLQAAIERLSTVLEHSYARTGRYAQVEAILDATYEASEMKRLLDGIDETSAQASQVVSMGAQVGDFLKGGDQALLSNFASALHTSRKFGEHPHQYTQTINDKIALSQEPSNVEEAIKCLLAVGDDSMTSLPTFKAMGNICFLLKDADEDTHELVKSAYVAVLGKLSGEMHFVLGMAQESDFNPVRGSTEQKSATKQEYNEAAKSGNDAAYNNMLCNSFAEARNQNMTFDEARSEVMPAFLEIATEPKAAANIALLEEDKAPLQRYAVTPPADDLAEAENSIVFGKFNKSMRRLVDLLEHVIYAASSGSKAVLSLRHLLGERVDNLSTELQYPDLQQVTQMLEGFTAETMNLIMTAPPIEERGGFHSTLSKLYSGTELEYVQDYGQLLLALDDDVRDMSATLFPGAGTTILNNSSAMSNSDVRNFVQSLLPSVLDAHLASLPSMTTSGEALVNKALVNKFLVAAISELENMEDAPGDEASLSLHRARGMVDAMLFHSDDPLEASGMNAEDLFTEAEHTMFEVGGRDDSFLTVQEEDGTSTMRAPFLWADELSKQCILRLLHLSSNARLTTSIANLRNKFTSSLSFPEVQKPLQLAEDEVAKMDQAMTAIFDVEKIDRMGFSEQQFQNVFNAAHYILYLTTADYITEERAPPRPDVPTELKDLNAAQGAQLKAWDASFTQVKEEASGMVVNIKTAAQELLDLFGVAKMVHQRLIVLEAVFSENSAEVFKLVHDLVSLSGSTPAATDRALWLLEATDPQQVKSLLEAELKGQTAGKTLDSIVLSVAFNLIEVHVAELCEMTSREGQDKADAVLRVATLRQQSLETEGGVAFAKFILSTTNMMISEAKADKATNAASKEEVQSLLDSIQLAIETQAWRSDEVMQRLQMFATPSGWVPILDAFSIAMSLSYNPESTTEEDTEKFQNTATSIQRLRSRRGTRVAKNFIECLQLLVASHADATTLATIAAAVASNRWPFSASSRSAYEHAAGLATNVDAITYLEQVASELKGSAGDRTVERLVEIMSEEVEGVNASIANLLSPILDGTISKMEQRVQNIHSLAESHTNANGKAIKKWKTDDIVEWSKEFKKVSKGYFTEEHTDKLDLMLAVFTRVTKKFKDYHIRNPQLLSILTFVDCMVQGKGQLGEIGTGEGKSLICLLCATARVFKGETVDIITSSPVLAERDAEEAVEWFDYFDMKVHNNCDFEAEADPVVRQKRYREHAIIYGTTGAFQRDILLTNYYNMDIRNKAGDCLIVDEVDTLFIDSVANTLFISHDIQDLKHLNEIFVSIWMAVQGPDVEFYSESSVELVKRFIEHQITKGNIHVPSWLKTFTENRLDTWIRNAYNAKSMEEGDQYTLYESGRKRGQVIVVDLYTGVEMPSTQWSNGLHQFVQLKHNNKLSAESLKAIFMANVNFVKMYGHRVIGMTGTLGSQSELDLLRRVYGATAFRMPRFREERYYEEPAVVVGNRARWREQVAEEVVVQSNNTEGFDRQRTVDDAAYQKHKLDKDKAKVVRLTAKIEEHNEEIKATEALETSMLARTVELTMPQDVDMRAVLALELVISDLETSKFVSDGDATYGQDRLETLTAAVSTMKSHLQSISTAEAESSRLSKKVGDLQFEQEKKSMQGDAPTTNIELDSAKDAKATAEEDVLRLRKLTASKGNAVLVAISSAQQGISFLAQEHLKVVRKELEEDELDLQGEREDVEKRTIKLAASNDALASGKGGRAVLVICRNKNDCEDVRDAVIARLEDNLKLYVYTGITEGITEVNQKTGKTIQTHVNLTRVKPHDVIVATNIAGRGTSIKTTDVLEQCGGLHVVCSYVPSNIRVEMQAWGRTSRQGRNGSGRFVVYDPRVTTSMQIINIDYLLSERDVLERLRLEQIEVETIPRVNLESILFKRFSKMSATFKASFKITVSADLQQKELRDQWAFFLESQNEILEDTYKHPKQSEAELLSALQVFEEEQSEAATDVFGLISSPGNLIHVANEALRAENYYGAGVAAQKIIDTDKQHAAYGYYYHALSLFGSGTEKLQTKKKALKELEKAVYLLKREGDKLQAQSQVITSINGARHDEGIGTESKAFETNNSNIQALIQVHIGAAEKLTGRALTEADFDTSAINGDATKEVFDIFNEKDNLRNFVRPIRITKTMEVRLHVTASTVQEKQSVQFLRNARRGDGNRFLWQDNTLEIGDVTDAELNGVKASNLPWELALYRRGNEFESEERVRITFPEELDYAVPEILEKLRKVAQDGNGNPIPFSNVSITNRAKINDIFFTPLLAKAEIKTCLETITMSGPQDYLVIEDNYKSKAFGKWDSVGFSGIGDSMKIWILRKAATEKYLLRSNVIKKAKTLLEAKDVGNAESDAGIVATSIVSQGVAKVQKLQRLKPNCLSIIQDDLDHIAVKPSATEALIEKMPFDGFPLLEKHSSKIRAKLLECKGDNVTKEVFNNLVGDDLDEAIQSDSFLILQALARGQGLGSYLCERLELKVSDHKRDVMDGILSSLEETVDVEAVSKVTTAAELQGRLLTQHVLDMPTVAIGIDGEDNVDALAESIKTHLKAQIKEVAKRVKVEGESVDDKTTAMLDDIVAAMKEAVTELATLKGTLEVEFQTLIERMSSEKVPPELVDFIASATDITVKVVKKKTFADYWDWGAFVVAILGLIQVVAGVAILILTAGIATQVAGALIGEGIGDMMYAAVAGLTGTFSWKEYGIQKAISLVITVGIGLATAGIGTIVNKGAQVAAMAAKATIKAVVKAVAKKVSGEIIKAVASYAVGLAAEKVTELATKELFKLFKSKFQGMAESNAMCIASVASIKKTLSKMMETFGAEKAATYVKDAVSDIAAGAGISTTETRITGAVLKIASELSSNLGAIGSRLEKSGSKWAKTIAQVSKWIGYAAQAAGVVDAVQQIVRFLPEMYSKLNTRLLGVRASSSASTPTDVLTGSTKDAWIQKHMKLASTEIYDNVESITASGLTGAAINEVVSLGMNKLYSKTVDKLDKDYEELKMRAEASGAIKKLSRKTTLTDLERDQFVTLQTKLTDPKNKYPSILETVDPVKNGSMKILYKGNYTTLDKVSGMLGTTGLQVLPLKSGGAGYLVRPKYEDYVSGLSVNKQANMFDLHAMAKTAKVNVSLLHTENGVSKTTNISPHTDGDVQTVKMKLLKNAEYPEGRYVLVDNDENIQYKHEFKTIGSASAAQQLLYAKAYATKKDHNAAMDLANSEDELDTFLSDTRKQAIGDKKTQGVYQMAEYEAETSILGGSSPHPDLPLVPVPRPKKTVTRRRLAATRGLKTSKKVTSKAISLPYKKDVTDKKKKDVLAPDKPVLARAVPLKRRGGGEKLRGPVLRQSRSRGVIRLKSDNTNLRRLVGTRSKFGTGTEVVDTGIGKRPRVSYVSMQRMKETLKKYHLDTDKPLRFLVEAGGDNALAVEIKDGLLSYSFSFDGFTGSGAMKWGNTSEKELESVV